MWVGILFSTTQKLNKNYSKELFVIFKNKIEFFGRAYGLHMHPGGTLATVGPPSFWDISYSARATGLVLFKKIVFIMNVIIHTYSLFV